MSSLDILDSSCPSFNLFEDVPVESLLQGQEQYDSDLDSLFFEATADKKPNEEIDSNKPLNITLKNDTSDGQLLLKDKAKDKAQVAQIPRRHSIFMPRSFTRPHISKKAIRPILKRPLTDSHHKKQISSVERTFLELNIQEKAQDIKVGGYEEWMEDEGFATVLLEEEQSTLSDAFCLTDDMINEAINDLKMQEQLQIAQILGIPDVASAEGNADLALRDEYRLITQNSVNKNIGRFKRSSVDRRSSNLQECLDPGRLQTHLHFICRLNLPFDNESRLFSQSIADVIPHPLEPRNKLRKTLEPLKINRIRYLRGLQNNQLPQTFTEKFTIVTNNLKFSVNDYYSPEFFRINGNNHQLTSNRSGLCPYCVDNHFYDLLNSSYFYHLLGCHGVLASRVVPNPINHGVYEIFNSKKGIFIEATGAECPICTKFIEIDLNRDRPFYKYFDHFSKEHK